MQSRKNGNWYYAEYSTFVVLPEAQNYKLQVAGYSGNAGGQRFTSVHNGRMFTTYDRDNDLWPDGNCACGGFWYNWCYQCGVNNGLPNIFEWYDLPGGRLLQASRMWLQCK